MGDDYITTETDVFEEIVVCLSRQRSRIWTDTFYEVASYIGEKSAGPGSELLSLLSRGG